MTDAARWESGTEIPADRLNEPIDAIDELRHQLADLREELQSRVAPATPFWLRLSGESSGTYDWEQVTRNTNNSAWVLMSNGLDSTSASTNTKAVPWKDISNLLTSTPYTFGLCYPVVTNSGGMEYPFVPLGTAEDPDDDSYSGEHTEAVIASVAWDVESGISGKDGKRLNLMTGMNYSHAGDEILYGYYVSATLDSTGKLIDISDETRFTIDTPDSC